MPVPSFSNVGENLTVQQLTDFVYGHIRKLNDFLAHLDTLNVDELNANVIIAGSISTDKLAAESITTEKIAAGAVTAEKITVNELSAITANLGTITAGSITTNAQIDVGTNATIGDNLYMNETSPTSKGIIFNNQGGGYSARISVLSGDMGLNVDGHITMTIGSSQGLVVNQKVTASGFEALSGVVQANYINAIGTLSAGNGASGTFYVASSLGGPIDTEVTVSSGIITSIT
ncbi:hypothetical protein [Paenibacillus contaminans]|uniref:Uncharacterized protein n=1 Tax=Paenibacillus contaminans TaxID=450362 RepID=A0A329MQE2_9BACL|nr:hypothetical protein [Paenibacillus contaminans]RAV22201.1 hypothetical protein DQG23_04415 [Paenibacillus contaminans]